MKASAFAPGRVELLGNHTDYNEGVVLSAALDLGITVCGQLREDGRIVLRSGAGHEEVVVDTGGVARSGTWADYPLGVWAVLRDGGFFSGGFEADYSSTLPVGAGLSSSAAIEVATALLLSSLGGFRLGKLELAKLCRRAENEFVGVSCGLLDQASSVFGEPGHALYLDFRSEEIEAVPFPPGFGLLVVNSGVKHELTGGEYNERREACFAAAAALGVRALRDTDEAALAAGEMPVLVRRRAAHVVGENRRVFEAVSALRGRDAATFGRLMTESHRSSVSNFENSTGELDLLCELAVAQPGLLGARLTGGGFGGAIVAIGETAALAPAGENIAAAYHARTGHTATPILCTPGGGARVLD